MTQKSFYVTTPIYYVNDNPHLGHVYTTVVADVLARFHRFLGDEVFFLTGTDEHGQKVERSADKSGIKPKELADRVVARYHDLWPRLSISNDAFIRTTDELHERGVVKIFEKMKEAGDIYLGKYEGWYCTSCESFWPESQLAEGGVCPDDGVKTERLAEDSYFFRLSAYQDRLLDYYRSHPNFVRPKTRLAEVSSFVRSGLKDLSVSRTTFRWGVPVPGDPDHVVYVWIDALSNYVTALGYADGADRFKRFWPANLQLVGKDILRHHAVYWPAMLMSAGLPLPETVFAHGWWLRDERKMSKSTGNVVRVEPLMEAVGADALRYFLLREMVFGLDASFSDESLLARYNSDLANDLGNLASRVLTLAARHAGDGLPAPGESELADAAGRAVKAWKESFADCAFKQGLEAVSRLVSETNRYLVKEQPWKTKETQPLAAAAEALRILAGMLLPVMPGKMVELLDRLGQSSPAGPEDLAFGCGKPGAVATKQPPLFPRISPKSYFKGVEPAAKEAPPEEEISIEEFMKVKLKTAVIKVAEAVPNADKLLKLTLDVGGEPRTIVAGIALGYKPEDLEGRTIVIVANLRKAKIRGVESQGMLLAADVDGRPVIAGFAEKVPSGRPVR